MWCPKCTGKTKVTSTHGEETVTRSRRCLECNYSFMSKEAIFTDKYWDEYAGYTYEVGTGKQREDTHHKNQGVLFE